MLVSLIMLMTSAVQTTFGYIVTKTDSLVNTFVPCVVSDTYDFVETVTVNKTVENTGKAAVGLNGFEFVLENVTTGEKTALNSDVYGKAVFTLTFSKEDVGKTYTYRLSETDQGIDGVTYDTTVYDITIAISLGEDNKLISKVTMNGSEVENCIAEFKNICHADQPVIPPTGDNNKKVFWFIMMIISSVTCVVLLLMDKRCRESEKR